jgi:hypothetical protein
MIITNKNIVTHITKIKYLRKILNGKVQQKHKLLKLLESYRSMRLLTIIFNTEKKNSFKTLAITMNDILFM